MYKCLILLAIFVFFSCNKQGQYTNDENETGIVSIINNEKSPQEDNIYNEYFPEENAIRPGVVLIANEENFPLEYIIGTWWSGTPTLLMEIEFTNNGILNIKELNIWNNNFVEDSFPYKIEENNIIIENIIESNNFDEVINNFFLSSGAYITRLDDKALTFKKWIKSRSGGYLNYSFISYRGTLEELSERENIRANYENKLKEFISNEMLNGIIFQGDINDENGVINTYGVPIKDEIIEYSDGRGYEGGLYLMGIREITYEDLIHRYYVFTRNVQYYVDVIIDKKLDRLTTINIGAASEEVTAVFGSSYWRKEGEDIIYMLGGDHSTEPLRWVRFSIENNIVTKISFIITSWG